MVAQIDQISGELLSELDLISRGFVFAKENESLMQAARQKVHQALSGGKAKEIRLAREIIMDTLERFFFEKTGRRPMILPVVVEA